jgi:ferric-dicitrate binding protein FerR (iron transport regulator)
MSEGPAGRTGPDDAIRRLLRLAGPRPAAPEATTRRVNEAVLAHWRTTVFEERRRRTLRLVSVLALAGALVVAAGLGLFWRGRSPHGADAPVATVLGVAGETRRSLEGGDDARAGGAGDLLSAGDILPAGGIVATGSDGRASVRLYGGGVELRLDHDTRLRLATTGRVDLIAGAIYADTGDRPPGVPPAGAAALEVYAALGQVRDVGTRFEVRLADGGMQVSVRDGTAVLTSAGGSHTADGGSRLRLGADGAVTRDALPADGSGWGWVLAAAPPFAMEGRTLGDYLGWLARETGWTIAYGDDSLRTATASIVLHGSLTGLRPDETPGAVLPICGLAHRLEGTTLHIDARAAASPPR